MRKRRLDVNSNMKVLLFLFLATTGTIASPGCNQEKPVTIVPRHMTKSVETFKNYITCDSQCLTYESLCDMASDHICPHARKFRSLICPLLDKQHRNGIKANLDRITSTVSQNI
jgi:hypothetical protein